MTCYEWSSDFSHEVELVGPIPVEPVLRGLRMRVAHACCVCLLILSVVRSGVRPDLVVDKRPLREASLGLLGGLSGAAWRHWLSFRGVSSEEKTSHIEPTSRR